VHNPDINGDLGSDGSTAQTRANDAGFVGTVAQTVATNPALAINGIDILGQWYWDPVAKGIIENCANTVIGVWTENSLSRSVTVAVYGQPA
jgi:peptidoglycan biosynthesis protein MviN/MurJ (putative lipid II flippase)